MGASSYNVADITRARQAIGAEAGRFGSVGDAVPADVGAGMFGTLPNSAAVARAAGALCSSLRAEFARAESLAGAIERALDSNLTSSGETEESNKQAFTSRKA